MNDMVYLAAGLRIFLVVAVPVTLLVYACTAVATACTRLRTAAKRRHK